MVATLFLGFLALMVAVVVAQTGRHLSVRTAVGVLAGLSGWFIYVGLMAYFGVVRNTTMRPPGIAFIVGPVVVFLLVVIVRSGNSRVTTAFPLWMILGTQSFRIGVELFLHQIWIAGVIPSPDGGEKAANVVALLNPIS